jgi:hypothetical protein
MQKNQEILFKTKKGQIVNAIYLREQEYKGKIYILVKVNNKQRLISKNQIQ